MTRHTPMLFVFGLLLPLFVSGCGGSGSDTPVLVAERGLRTRVTSGAQAACGQTTTLTVSVTNTGRSAITLGSANAAIFDVEVDDASGKRVWDYGLANVVGATQTVIAPAQTQTFTVAWYGADSQGVGLPPGAYTVKATLIPQTINGAALSAVQQTALTAATTPVTVSTSCGKTLVPGELTFGLTTDQATPNTNRFGTVGKILGYFPLEHDGVLTVKSGVSVEAAIAYLLSDKSLRFAAPVVYGGDTGGGV